MSQSKPTGKLASGDNAPGAPKPILSNRQPYLQQLADANTELEDRSRVTQRSNPAAQVSAPMEPSPLADFVETLKRLVDQIAKLLQAEKCVFFMHDPAVDILYATHPALGFSRQDLHLMEQRVADIGLTSEVFRTNTPLILSNASTDLRVVAEHLTHYNIHSSVSVPLIIERRDEENRLIEHSTVGVVHAFNKKNGGAFVDEDLWLLQRMAITGAAVIKWAQVYGNVVQQEQEFIHTIDSLNAGMLMVGTNGLLQQVNPSARRILSIGMETPLLGVPYETVIENNQVCALLQQGLQFGADEVADEITVMLSDPGQGDRVEERIYQVQCAPVRYDRGVPAGVVAIFNDITEIRGVERMKNAFISTVSHELRTPLTSIKGFISTLLDDENSYYDEPTRREFYQIINTECDRLTRLVTDLLDISRIEQGSAMQLNWQEVDVAALCRKVIETQRPSAKSHMLELKVSDDFPKIQADPDKLDQILTNLVSNAIKYSPDGGQVRIILGRARGRHDRITIRVTDEGMGISPEHIPKLFDRFYRVDNRDSRKIWGTGIGLAIVKGLTEAHHGTVTVESEPDKGSTFTVTLPVHHDPANE